MHLVVAPDYRELSRLAADWIESRFSERGGIRLLLATGNTPMGAYTELARRHGERPLPLAEAMVVQLDEYVGIGPDDRRSLYGWLQRAVVEPLGIEEDRVVRLRGDAEDIGDTCREYETAIERLRGITASVLGLGPNGHLGFNEPPADPSSSTRAVELTAESVASNARYWGAADDVPRRALTAGMRVILGARRTVLLVSGEAKRDILHRMLAQPNNPWVPASYLFSASDVTVIADRAAWPGAIPEDLRSSGAAITAHVRHIIRP
jgi:glucosamine-6-phosphate deaminase